MRLIQIAIRHIVKQHGFPTKLRATATFTNGRNYDFDACFTSGYPSRTSDLPPPPATATKQDPATPPEASQQLLIATSTVSPEHHGLAVLAPPNSAAPADNPDDPPRSALRASIDHLAIELEHLYRNIYNGTLRAPIGSHVRHLANTARKALVSHPILEPICQSCGGNAVHLAAATSWNKQNQAWEIHTLDSLNSTCSDCPGTCGYTMTPVPALR